jgi:hypothetical protein
MRVVTKTKLDFTTKVAKNTKFNNKKSETFVAFVRFVVRQYFVGIECVGNESKL